MTPQNRVILITGAGGGLGGAAAQALARDGASLVLLDNSIPRLEKVYDAVIAAGGPEPALYPFDLAGANAQEYQDLADTLATHYGALHGILHSAAAFGAFTPLSQQKPHEWAQAITVNLHAPFLLTQELLPLLQASGDASVVFTTDSAVRQAKAYHGGYGVSKIAMEAMAGIWAAELAAAGKIRVNILCPGPVDSPIRKKAYPGEDKTSLPTPADLGPAYLYLFGAASRGVTGQALDARSFIAEEAL